MERQVTEVTIRIVFDTKNPIDIPTVASEFTKAYELGLIKMIGHGSIANSTISIDYIEEE